MENSSLEESEPPSAVIAADLGEMHSQADAVLLNLPMKDLPLQCQTSSSSDNLHSNDVVDKTEEMPETLETQNVLEKVTPSRRRKPRKTQKVIKVEEKQKLTDDEDLVEYISSPTDHRKDAIVITSVTTSPSQSVTLNSSLKTEAITAGDSPVQDDAVQAVPQPVTTPSGKDVPSKHRKINSGRLSSVIHCTACNCQIGATTSLTICAHPALKVLVCQKCYKWYSSDEIEKGADGMDEQCRWCSEGGDLICCDLCHNAFCKSCIRRNLGRKALMDIIKADDESKWSCYICDPKPILHLVEQCASIMESLTTKKKSPKAPRQKGMHCRKQKGTQPKNVGSELEPLAQQSLFKTSNSLTTQLPSLVAGMWQSTPAGISYNAMNRGFLSADMVENAQRMISLPSFQQTSFIPIFPGLGQLISPFGGVLGTAVSLEAAVSAAMTTGRIMNYPTMENSMPTMENSMEMLWKLDYLLSASTSMLNVLTSLQEQLKLVGGVSAGGFMSLLTEGRRMIAVRLWSAQRNYLQTFQNVIHEDMPVKESVAQQSCMKTFQKDIPKLNCSGVGWPVDTGSQSSARRKHRKRREVIDLTCSNDEMLKKCVPLSTVSSNPLFSNCDRDASSVPFGIRLADVHGVFKSDSKLSEATKTPLGPSCHSRKRKYPVTAS